MSNPPIPVAQYLRMSTERQQYSLENQADAIQKYADRHGYSVVQTYSDSARTGVIFKNRKGLQKLIQDVVQGLALYKAVLVYDVSRWGRFQDTDESAHYEFLCKSVGIPVHYCAESFSNDGELPSLIMKSLKRVMAGEYSRELGVKIFAAQKRLARLGFRQGGQPGYGLRRLLISSDRLPKQRLRSGERKSITSDRVIQIPGPGEEVRCVREIYRLFLQERMSFRAIADELNRREIKYLGGTEWEHRDVGTILTHPKYAGFNVYGRSSTRLYSRRREIARSDWTILPGAFEALVEPEIYAQVQLRLSTFTRNKSDKEMLDVLRVILAREGRLTMELIKNAPHAPSATTFRTRFGSLGRAYELVGYDCHGHDGWLEKFRRIRTLRENLMREIVSLPGACVRVDDRGGRFRTRLRLRGGRLISVIASRCFRGYKGAVRWLVKCVPDESRLVTLIARLNPDNSGFKDFFVVPPIRHSRSIYLSEKAKRLRMGEQLYDLSDFLKTIGKVDARKQTVRPRRVLL